MSVDLIPLDDDLRAKRAALLSAALRFGGPRDEHALFKAALEWTAAATPESLRVDPRVPALLALLERAQVMLETDAALVPDPFKGGRRELAAEIARELWE